MKTITRTIALTGAGALLAVPATVLVAAPASADVERHVPVGAGVAELSVDREAGRLEVDAGIEGVRPGSRWRVTLTHDGTRFFRKVLRADYEGDLDVERYRANTAGSDTITLKVKKIGGKAKATTSITVS